MRVGFDVAFSPTLSWVNLIQYDNVSEVAGFNTRLLWIPKAGREIYFVINHNVEDFNRDNQFHSSSVDATAKVNYTVRLGRPLPRHHGNPQRGCVDPPRASQRSGRATVPQSAPRYTASPAMPAPRSSVNSMT